jgi:hypothetical protein
VDIQEDVNESSNRSAGCGKQSRSVAEAVDLNSVAGRTVDVNAARIHHCASVKDGLFADQVLPLTPTRSYSGK